MITQEKLLKLSKSDEIWPAIVKSIQPDITISFKDEKTFKYKFTYLDSSGSSMHPCTYYFSDQGDVDYFDFTMKRMGATSCVVEVCDGGEYRSVKTINLIDFNTVPTHPLFTELGRDSFAEKTVAGITYRYANSQASVVLASEVFLNELHETPYTSVIFMTCKRILKFKEGFIVVAFDGDRAVGCSLIGADALNVFVNNEDRRRGIGFQLCSILTNNNPGKFGFGNADPTPDSLPGKLLYQKVGVFKVMNSDYYSAFVESFQKTESEVADTIIR